MWKLFSKKSKQSFAKGFNFNDFISLANLGYAGYNIDINRFLKEIPENPFVSSALERMQQGFYPIAWNVYKETAKDKQLINSNIVAMSLRSPNIIMDTNDFLYHCYLYWSVYGEFLMQKIKLFNKYDLWVYSPQEYEIEHFDKNLLQGIKSIKIGDQVYTGKDLDNFVYKKAPNLYSKTKGLNKVTSLVLLHDYYCLISRWNNNLLKNSGKRQFLILLNMLPTGESIEKLQDKIAESSGADNVGKPTILTGFDERSKIQNIDFAPQDFDFMSAVAEIRNTTSNVLNVPDLLIGGKDNAKFNNLIEAKKALYTENIIPACEQIMSALNRLFVRDLKLNELVGFDTSRIEVLRDNQIDLINALNVSEMHTINEKRKLLNLESIDGADEILVKGLPSTLTDVLSGELEPQDNNPSSEDIDDGENKE